MAAEMAIFLCRDSDLQADLQFSAGDENPNYIGNKTVSDTVCIRIKSLTRRVFQTVPERADFRGCLKYLSYF